MEGLHVASLGSGLCVHRCVSLGHYSQIVGRLSSLVREAKIKSNGCFFFFGFFFPNFTAVTTNRKRQTVW